MLKTKTINGVTYFKILKDANNSKESKWFKADEILKIEKLHEC